MIAIVAPSSLTDVAPHWQRAHSLPSPRLLSDFPAVVEFATGNHDVRAACGERVPPTTAQQPRLAHSDRVREHDHCGMKSSNPTPRNPGQTRVFGEPGEPQNGRRAWSGWYGGNWLRSAGPDSGRARSRSWRTGRFPRHAVGFRRPERVRSVAEGGWCARCSRPARRCSSSGAPHERRRCQPRFRAAGAGVLARIGRSAWRTRYAGDRLTVVDLLVSQPDGLSNNRRSIRCANWGLV